MSENLRDKMPNTAAFIDALRDSFGAEHINGQIRKGLAGEPTFYARENGYVLGTPVTKEERYAADRLDR